jgi:probable dihydroxyacetone kinase regulator
VSESTLTKKALAASLKSLTLSVPLAKVTVAMIVDHCGLNRQTFYYHFPDKYHLVNWIYDQEALALIDDCRSYRTWTEGILRVFSTLHRDRHFYVNALNDPGPNAFDDYLFRATQGLIKAVVDEVAADLRTSELDRAFLADFYAFAFVGVAVRWIKEGMEEAPATLARKIQSIVDGALKTALVKGISV